MPRDGRIGVESHMNTTPTTIPLDRLGVCSWSLRPENGADLIASVARLGLPKIQLALGPVVEDPEGFGDVMGGLREAGVVIASGMLEAVGDHEVGRLQLL